MSILLFPVIFLLDVGTEKVKYYTVGTVPTSNRKITGKSKIDMT
jgi:hypothetical protein